MDAAQAWSLSLGRRFLTAAKRTCGARGQSWPCLSAPEASAGAGEAMRAVHFGRLRTAGATVFLGPKQTSSVT